MRAFPAALYLISALMTVAALAGACLPSPPAMPRADGVQQIAPPTPELDTAPVAPDAPEAPPGAAPAASEECPGVESTLMQIVRSASPVAQARQLQLPVRDDKIQVVLLLDGPDTSFLQDFDVEASAQAGMRVQAFVPPARVCELAKSERVVTISLPAPAAIQ